MFNTRLVVAVPAGRNPTSWLALEPATDDVAVREPDAPAVGCGWSADSPVIFTVVVVASVRSVIPPGGVRPVEGPFDP